ncbi:MAG: CBS domain-containing protein [Holosporales bacterium]|jgi:CBS domain containing-hemolysin-like protein|nr:CBS domain-containing protein [Holosporales bacterium]
MSESRGLPEKNTFWKRVARQLKCSWRWCLRKESDTSIREAIEELIEEDADSGLSIGTDEKLLLNNVLSLKDLTAKDVMIPYANIIALPISATQEEIIAMFIREGIQQIPVYSGTIDNIVGVLSLKHVLILISGNARASLKSVLEDIPFIAPTMRTLDLLLQMRETGHRMAVVVDEYGGVEGLVTFASLISEIIGDIQYAEDHGEDNHIEIQPNGCITLNASTTIDELKEALKRVYPNCVNLLKGHENEDVETVGGLVTLLAGYVPLRGELITHGEGIEFEILDADPRKVKKVAIRNLIQTDSSEELQ